jgi:hypothetical protein
LTALIINVIKHVTKQFIATLNSRVQHLRNMVNAKLLWNATLLCTHRSGGRPAADAQEGRFNSCLEPKQLLFTAATSPLLRCLQQLRHSSTFKLRSCR